jgi:hypothetical protein
MFRAREQNEGKSGNGKPAGESGVIGPRSPGS